MNNSEEKDKNKYKSEIFKDNPLLVSFFKAFVETSKKPDKFRKLLLNVSLGSKKDINEVVGDFNFNPYSKEYRKAVRIYVKRLMNSLDDVLKDDSEENLLNFYHLGKNLFYNKDGSKINLPEEKFKNIGFALNMALNTFNFSKMSSGFIYLANAFNNFHELEKIYEDVPLKVFLNKNKVLLNSIHKKDDDLMKGLFFLFFLAELKNKKPAFLSILKSFYYGLIENEEYLKMISSDLVFPSNVLELAHLEPTIKYPSSINPKYFDYLLFIEKDKLNKIKKEYNYEKIDLFEAYLNFANLKDDISTVFGSSSEDNKIIRKQFYPPIVDKINILSDYFEKEENLSEKEKEEIEKRSEELMFHQEDLKIEKAKENDVWFEKITQIIFDEILGDNFNSTLEEFVNENENHIFIKDIKDSLIFMIDKKIDENWLNGLFSVNLDLSNPKNSQFNKTNKGIFYYFFNHNNKQELFKEYQSLPHFLVEHKNNPLIQSLLKKIFEKNDTDFLNFIKALDDYSAASQLLEENSDKNESIKEKVKPVYSIDFIDAFPVLQEVAFKKLNKIINKIIIGKKIDEKTELANFNKYLKILVNSKHKSLPETESKIINILDNKFRSDIGLLLKMFDLGEKRDLLWNSDWKEKELNRTKENISKVFEKIKLHNEVKNNINFVSIEQKETKKNNFRF